LPFREISDRDEGKKLLRERLEETTPIETGFLEVDGVAWQFIDALTDESPRQHREDELNHHRWSGMVLDNERWLFLHFGFDGEGKEWSFAFDCNEPDTASFLKQMLRDRRVTIHFPNDVLVPLDGIVTQLIEDFGNGVNLYIPDWQSHYKE
jgi:hypothetical protein